MRKFLAFGWYVVIPVGFVWWYCDTPERIREILAVLMFFTTAPAYDDYVKRHRNEEG